MMKLTLLALVAVCMSGVNSECTRNGTRCLDYTVLNTINQDYEERMYPSIVWVSATAEARSKSDVSRSLIRLLYAYIGGGNNRGEKLSMVIPVRTKKVVNEGRNTYTMSLALKPEQSEDPPVPLNGNVTVNREPRTMYLVKSFGGMAREDDIWDSQALNLKNSVANEDSVNSSFYFMSVYDSPWRVTDRLNEVWMIKEK